MDEHTIHEVSDAAELLTPLATEFRYPGDIMEPDPADADEAYSVAQQSCTIVLSKLPDYCRDR